MVYIYLMLAIEIMITICIYVRNKGDVFSPGFISMALFFLSTLCIIYNDDLWTVSYTKNTFCIVLLGFFSILCADSFAKRASKYKYKFGDFDRDNNLVLPQSVMISNKLSLFIIAIMLLGLVEQVFELIRMGNSIGVGMAINLIGAVKESDINFTAFGKLFYQFNNIFLTIYLFSFAYRLGGKKNKKKESFFYIVPILLGFMNLIITGSRSILYRAVFIFVITYIISYKNNHAGIKASRTSKNLIKNIAVPMAVLTIGFYMLRVVTKGTTRSASRSFMEYVTYYIGSPLYIFDKYITNPIAVTQGSDYFGGLTFSGFYNSLYKFGVLNHPVDNLNWVYVGDISRNGYFIGGNEYSLFMRPYDDFGLIGMVLFVFVLYYFFSRIYYRYINTRCGGKSLNTLLIYSYFYYIIPMAFYYPFTVQESKIMNIVYMVVMVVIFKKIAKRIYFCDNKMNIKTENENEK